jgi:hypothetical protein
MVKDANYAGHGDFGSELHLTKQRRDFSFAERARGQSVPQPNLRYAFVGIAPKLKTFIVIFFQIIKDHIFLQLLMP